VPDRGHASSTEAYKRCGFEWLKANVEKLPPKQ